MSYPLAALLENIYGAKSRKYQGVFKVKSRGKTWQVRGIWSQQLEHKQVPKRGTEPVVLKGKRSLLSSHTRCICSMETTHNSVKAKLGINVVKLVESLIGREVTVGQGSECRLTFVRGLLHIAEQDPHIDHKTSLMTISSVPQGIPVWVAYWKVAWPSEKKTFIPGASPGVLYKLKVRISKVYPLSISKVYPLPTRCPRGAPGVKSRMCTILSLAWS